MNSILAAYRKIRTATFIERCCVDLVCSGVILGVRRVKIGKVLPKRGRDEYQCMASRFFSRFWLGEVEKLEFRLYNSVSRGSKGLAKRANQVIFKKNGWGGNEAGYVARWVE